MTLPLSCCGHVRRLEEMPPPARRRGRCSPGGLVGGVRLPWSRKVVSTPLGRRCPFGEKSFGASLLALSHPSHLFISKTKTCKMTSYFVNASPRFLVPFIQVFTLAHVLPVVNKETVYDFITNYSYVYIKQNSYTRKRLALIIKSF